MLGRDAMINRLLNHSTTKIIERLAKLTGSVACISLTIQVQLLWKVEARNIH